MSTIGIIGGSGLYQIEGLTKSKEVKVTTPFGEPSEALLVAGLEGKEVVFLPRHGKGHTISPSDINYRANIYAMKSLGVERIISVTACGSLRQDIKPLDFVVPDQFVDRTNQARKYSFFDQGIVVHTSFAHPICQELASELYESVRRAGVSVHIGGTYLNMEGPQFSTLAESNLYRHWGMDIIGMTNIIEARLAREAEICYATLAAVTDYDCWHPEHDMVTVEAIIANLNKNVVNAKRIIKILVAALGATRSCTCQEALKYAIATPAKAVSRKTRERLKLLIGRYMK
ncbi:S-methyl-5'-thioadenosine phosphorylase [Candidatus Omnitrophota bacterium]